MHASSEGGFSDRPRMHRRSSQCGESDDHMYPSSCQKRRRSEQSRSGEGEQSALRREPDDASWSRNVSAESYLAVQISCDHGHLRQAHNAPTDTERDSTPTARDQSESARADGRCTRRVPCAQIVLAAETLSSQKEHRRHKHTREVSALLLSSAETLCSGCTGQARALDTVLLPASPRGLTLKHVVWYVCPS